MAYSINEAYANIKKSLEGELIVKFFLTIIALLRFSIVFILLSIATLFFLVVQFFLRIISLRKINRLFAYYTLAWISRSLVQGLGVKVIVRGLENIPRNCGVVFMSNHQEFSDIILCYGYLKTPIAMVAKKELGYIPFLSLYMRSLECYMIDRKNPKQAMMLFQRAKHHLQEEHYSVLIYPEGTRSRGPKNRNFMVGSARLAYLAQAPIVPVTISGSWRATEYIAKLGGSKTIDIIIHPYIEVKDFLIEEKQALMEKVQKIVESGFTSSNVRPDDNIGVK